MGVRLKGSGRQWAEVYCVPVGEPADGAEGVPDRDLRETVFVARWQVVLRWKRRATAAFIGLAVAATLAGYLGYHASAKSDRNTRAEAQRAVLRSCTDRADLRLTVAVGFDELRRTAILPRRGEKARVDAFLRRTQPPIDRLLGEAAGHVEKTDPRQPVENSVLEPIRADATASCLRQASRFDPSKPPG